MREHDEKASAYRTVERHTGLQAWRVFAEPINEDKAIMRKHLLPLVNNPIAGKALNEVEDRLRDWNTNCILIVMYVFNSGGSIATKALRRV